MSGEQMTRYHLYKRNADNSLHDMVTVVAVEDVKGIMTLISSVDLEPMRFLEMVLKNEASKEFSVVLQERVKVSGVSSPGIGEPFICKVRKV